MDHEIKEHPTIAMDAVESSQVAKIGHHPETNTLAIQFSNRKNGSPGGVYHYENITPKLFADFKGAESVGSHFYKHIKPFADRFPYVKVA